MSIRLSRAASLAALLVAIPACNSGAGDDANPPPQTGTIESAIQIPSQQAKLIPSDGGEFDLFGLSVALSGNTALIGATRNDELGSDAGAAYVFVRSGTSWAPQAKLLAPDGAANDSFGTAVAIAGDTAVVTATGNDGASSDTGAAYVFVRTGTAWALQAKLTAGDAIAADQIGVSVALTGDTVVVGATNTDDRGERSGSAYVFTRTGTAWTQQTKLLASDGVEFDQFGISVAASGDSAIVGAWGDDDNGLSSGSAYVFTRAGTAWTQQAKLLAGDGVAIDEFGISVALDGDTALIGAVFNDARAADSGAAYVFTRTGAAWIQQAKLSPDDGAESDTFGNSVALQGDVAVIGSPNDGSATGSAYVFARTGTTWTQEAKLLASDGASLDFLGVWVALSGDTAIAGALGDDDAANSAGAAYIYTLTPAAPNGSTCTSNAQCGSGFCTDGVCCDTACGSGDPLDCQACSAAAGAPVNGTCAPRSATTVCRASAGLCDLAERCDGASPSCPTDAVASSATLCRAAIGTCDVAERCDGVSPSCPTDAFASSDTLCRASAGICDLTERCTGTSALCPGNALEPPTTVCRPARNDCDLRELCTGDAISCPANRHRPNFSLCRGIFGLPGICLVGHCFP